MHGPLAAAPLMLAGAVVATFAVGEPAGPASTRAVTWDEARPLVARLADSLPATLAEIPPASRPARWPSWVKAERQAALARLARGEEDSLVNLLLFGTSFTTEPRLTPAFLAKLNRDWQAGNSRAAEERLTTAYRQRAADLVTACARSGADERMQFARQVLERNGIGLSTDAERLRARDYLLAGVVRVRQEAATLAQALDTARRLPDATMAFAERSRLFRDRGLAPDSSVMTEFALDGALQAARERGLLAPGSVRRVAIIGPGLDFVDKQEGYDFYPPQSLQPFATIDSLLRSGLAVPARLEVTTIDISPRVNAHLRGAVGRARREAAAYRLVLPLDSAGEWLDDAVSFWQRFGDRVGASIDVAVPPALPGIRARGVAVRPEIIGRLDVVDANIVYDRLNPKPKELFDLAIATNVLVYYDTFEQTLALANVAAMLRPGGLLVSNNSLLEVPEVPMRSAGYVTVRFSSREGDGEHMVFYERARLP